MVKVHDVPVLLMYSTFVSIFMIANMNFSKTEARFSAASSSFPRTRVISLSHHTSRRQHMAHELSAKNVPFEWLDAVDGKRLTPSDLAANATLLGRWFMTPGMVGCFLSHRQCWEHCVRSGEDLLVFEDDVTLTPNFREIVVAAMTQLRVNNNSTIPMTKRDSRYTRQQELAQENAQEQQQNLQWDVLLLGALGCVHPQKSKFGLNWIPSLVGGKWRKTGRVANLPSCTITNSSMTTDQQAVEEVGTKIMPAPFLHRPMCPYGMHAYIITPQGAAKLLKRCLRASYHVDVVAWGLQELDIISIHPLIAWQTNDDTTIGGLVHVWSKLFPRLVADRYTGFELGWALTAPLLRVGGPLFGGKLLLTNGCSLAIMLVGLVTWVRTGSPWALGITLAYILLVSNTIRLLASKWNC